jgi:polyhydroxyalkanoate synthase
MALSKGKTDGTPERHHSSQAVQRREEHPYRDLDRIARALMARNTGGVSPFSAWQAWSDWALHLSRAPGRQAELVERALGNAVKLAEYAIADTADAPAEPPFRPKPYDHRFTDPGWGRMPFGLWQQAFLATQDWWDLATDELRRASPSSRFLGATPGRSRPIFRSRITARTV